MTAFIKKLVEENGKVFMVLDDEISTKELPVFLRDIKYIKKERRDIYEIAGEIIKVLKQELQSGYF
jgi:hypothetical protein